MSRFCATQRFDFGAAENMSRRVKRPLAKSRAPGDRPKGARPYRGSQAERSKAERPQAFRPGAKPARGPAEARTVKPFVPPEPEKPVVEAAPLPTKVQTTVVTPD